MINVSPFQEFAIALEAVAHDWPASDEVIATTPSRKHIRYDRAVEIAQTQVGKTVSRSGALRLATAPGVTHGLYVISRFYHNSAIAAALSGIDQGTLAGELHSDEAMGSLMDMAGLNQDRATLVEGRMNVLSGTTCTLEAPLLETYCWQDGRLSTSDSVLSAIAHASADTERRPKSDNEICHARLGGILPSILESVLTICERDENLFKHTLTNPPETDPFLTPTW